MKIYYISDKNEKKVLICNMQINLFNNINFNVYS